MSDLVARAAELEGLSREVVEKSLHGFFRALAEGGSRVALRFVGQLPVEVRGLAPAEIVGYPDSEDQLEFSLENQGVESEEIWNLEAEDPGDSAW